MPGRCSSGSDRNGTSPLARSETRAQADQFSEHFFQVGRFEASQEGLEDVRRVILHHDCDRRRVQIVEPLDILALEKAHGILQSGYYRSRPLLTNVDPGNGIKGRS